MSRCVLACLVGIGFVPALAAQEAPARFGEGTHTLRRIFFDTGFQPESLLGEPQDHARTLVVILGDTRPLELFDARLTALGGWLDFVRRGGALLVASDQRSTTALERNFGVWIDGDKVLPQAELVPPYRSIVECPFVVPQARVEPALFQASVLAPEAGLPVASNLPSRLRRRPAWPNPLPTLATLPVLYDDPAAGPLRMPAIFAVGGRLGRGRVLILADHSLFINDMMLQVDNGNIDLAYRCAEWLRGEGRSARDRILYYENGTIRQDFDIPLRRLPAPRLPGPEELLPVVNQTLHELEKENTFNAMLLHLVGGENGVWKGLIIALCGLVGGYGFVRLSQYRYHPEPGVPRLETVVAAQTPSGTLLQRRTQAQLASDNLWESAQALARQFFTATGFALAPTAEPRVDGGSRWTRGRCQRQVARLWQLAQDHRPVRISKRQFAALVADVRSLQQALTAGTLRWLRD